MKNLIITALLFSTVACFGQTKLIAHRSHSGSNASFRTALEHNLFDIGNSNFGVIEREVYTVDSVVMKRDGNILVLKQRYSISISGRGKPYNKVYMKDNISKSNTHAFLGANSIDSLKAQVKKLYPGFNTDSIQFIGFDKQLSRKKRPIKR